MASGIKDKVVIAGMGCSRFGERWDSGPDDLMVEAFGEALLDAGIERDQIEAAWLGIFFDEQSTGKSALPLSMALRLPNIPATRVENLCATGTEALRGAVYAVAAGACDIALAMGVEKLKDTGYAGLPERTKGTFEDLYLPSSTAPGAFAQLASAYAARHGFSMAELKRAMAHVSCKSHENATHNPKAHLHHRAAGARRAARFLPARRARLLRRQRRGGVRDRDVTGHGQEPRQARPGRSQGAAARTEQWRRDGPPVVGRHTHADDTARGQARLRRGRHPRSLR